MFIGSRMSTIQYDQYNGKLTSFSILSCMVASVGGVIFGYDVGISGGVRSMEPFLEKFFPAIMARMKNATKSTDSYCRFESWLVTAFASSLYFVGMFASIIAAPITQKYGRRMTMMIGGATYLCGAAIGGAAVCVWMLVLGRVLLGVGVGFVNQVVPIYISEMTLPSHRGAFMILFYFNHRLGFLLASLINFVVEDTKSSQGWHLSFVLASVPAIFLTVGAFFLPETPASLIQQADHNLQRAVGTLQRIRGTTNILAELNDIVNAMSATPVPFYQKIRHCRYRPGLIMVIAITFFSQMAGFRLVSFDAPTLLQRSLGLLEENTAVLISATLIGLFSVCANIIAVAMVDRLGRRPLFLIGGALMFAGQLMIARVVTGTINGMRYFLLAMICMYVLGFELSWGPLELLVLSEIFPLEIRSAGQSIATSVSFMFSFILVQTFQGLHCVFGGSIFYFVALWVGIMSGFIYFMLPEMKKVPMEQMNLVWREHWFWRRMVLTSDDDNGLP